MKALLVSGGMGTRLRPFSHTMSKQLIPIANKPVLKYALENIRDIGVTDLGVIVSAGKEDVAAVISDGASFGMRVTYIPQQESLGLAHCVAISRSFLGFDDFVMYLGDNMLPEGIGEVADRFQATRPVAQVVVQKVADPRAFGVVEVGKDGSVRELYEKPAQPRSNLAIIGVYFFTPLIHDAVEAIDFSARGELEITDAIAWMLRCGADVRAYDYRGYWKDIGDPGSVLECNRRILEDVRYRIEGYIDDASELSGPMIIESGARVVRSQLTGPITVGAGTIIEESVVGPGTSVGRDCVLRGAELSDSVVLDGVVITGVGGLRGSLIGRSATVDADSASQAHHRLIVGDHSRVTVAG